MASIAVLGIGNMGAPIAQRLLSAGHEVTVWNRTTSRTTPLIEAGARPAATPADAATDADLVITMLTDAAAVDTVLFGPSGAASTLLPGATVVEMSTIGPAAIRNLAKRLPRGVDVVDAPVGGGVGAAGDGRLTVLVGGAPAAVDRVAPVLEALGTVRRCGGMGSGAALKLVINAALVAGIAGLADSLAIAHAVGVDHDTALELLAGGALGGAVQRATATGVAFPIELAHKDLLLALAELNRSAAAAPILRAAERVLRDAPDREVDIATVAFASTFSTPEQGPRAGCLFCSRNDDMLEVIQVWEDRYWRLLVDLNSEVLGFSLLSPKRHVSQLTELSPDEAATFGSAMAHASAGLKAATGSAVVYVYVFDHPHLHVHLGPHQPEDALSHQIIRGEIVRNDIGGGLRRDISADFPIIPEQTLREMATRIRLALEQSYR